ncbi:Protein of unknown function [Bacillus wiedmannii]|uniref:Uncharacterized protein n=1 Tax=Bacillus wiedmannii TaxID=1890302 RepID=A0A1C4ETU7_9BACI|nr:Protein of unknown function [Bacillus wiedmannii]
MTKHFKKEASANN